MTGRKSKKRVLPASTTRRKPIKHGTQGGYSLHRYHGETPCRPCKDAHNAYVGAQHRANTRLRQAHLEEWRELFRQELGDDSV